MTLAAIERTGCIPGVSPDVYGLADFQRISRLAHDVAGIVLGDHKQMLAYSRIAPLVRRSGCSTFSEFLDSLSANPAACDEVVSALTTNHTYFNRESHHFDHFEEKVRPALLDRLQAKDRVRLWSAGCSSGEEVWTLLMVLLGRDRAAGRRIAAGDLRLLATDLAPHAIERAERAQYEVGALSAIPEDLRKCWSEAQGDRAKIAGDLLRLARFRRLNLLGEWPMRQTFDVIFCRNVMIYFDQPTKERLVYRLAQQLSPGGYLYIGHSERASGASMDLLEVVGPTVYRRKRA